MTTSQAAVVIGALSAFSMAAHAWTPEKLKQEIIDRCQAQMAEYGASIVKSCVDQESEAANALGRYPESARATVDRCIAQMRSNGWSVIKNCVDQELYERNPCRRTPSPTERDHGQRRCDRGLAGCALVWVTGEFQAPDMMIGLTAVDRQAVSQCQ
jgi:hypothetical protein